MSVLALRTCTGFAARQVPCKFYDLDHCTTIFVRLAACLGSIGESDMTCIPDAGYLARCMQLAACCRSLGLTAGAPGPQEFVNAGRLSRCALGLICCLPLPASGDAAGPHAQSQPLHMTLVEAILQSKFLLELSYGVQRLMPEHTPPKKGTAVCTCCSPFASAWSRQVPFERCVKKSQLLSSPSRAAAASAQQLAHVSVHVAVDALLRRLLEVVVQLVTWLEFAAVAADSEQLRKLQHLAIQQLACEPDPVPHKGTRELCHPCMLLLHYCAAPIDDSIRQQLHAYRGMPLLGRVLQAPVSLLGPEKM